MKICKSCGIEQEEHLFPSSGYHTRKDGTKTKVYKPVCGRCLVDEHKKRFYALWDKYLDRKCSRCGYDKCINALDLHHVNEEDKSFGFASRWSISESTFAKEVAKCVVLCANCHRELHAEQR